MIRILKVTSKNGKSPFYVPQQNLNGHWQEFFGYDTSSPYIHARAFDTIAEVESFLASPSIWKSGSNGPGIYAEVLIDAQWVDAERKLLK